MSFVSLHAPKPYIDNALNTMSPVLFSARKQRHDTMVTTPTPTLYEHNLEPIEIPYQPELNLDVALELSQNPETKTRFLRMFVNGEMQQISPVTGTELTILGEQYDLKLPETTSGDSDGNQAPAGQQRSFLVHVESGKTYAFKGLRQRAELNFHQEGKTLTSAPPPSVYSRPPITKHTMFSPIVHRFNRLKAPSLFLNNTPVALALGLNDTSNGLLAYNPITRESYSADQIGENQFTLAVPEQPNQTNDKTKRSGGFWSRLRRRKTKEVAPALTDAPNTEPVIKKWLVNTHPATQQITLSSYTDELQPSPVQQNAEPAVMTADGPLALKRGLEHKRTGIRSAGNKSTEDVSIQWLDSSDQLHLDGQPYNFIPGSEDTPPQLETEATSLILTNADSFKWEGYDGSLDFNLETGKEELHLNDPDSDEAWVFEFNDHVAQLDEEITVSKNESIFFRRKMDRSTGELILETYSRFDFEPNTDDTFSVVLDGQRYDIASLQNYIENIETGELYRIETNALEEEFAIINGKEYWLDTLRDFPDNTSNQSDAEQTDLRNPMSGWQLTSPADGHRFYWINQAASAKAMGDHTMINRFTDYNEVVFEDLATGNLHTGDLVTADKVSAFYQDAKITPQNADFTSAPKLENTLV